MSGSYTSIYLSPHADDAIFSCAGRIWCQSSAGQSVLIATLATGDPDGDLSGFARRLHNRCGMELDSVDLRRQEDRAACEILGIDLIHGHLLDAIYRSDTETRSPMYPGLKRIFKRVHPADTVFPREVERLIGDLPAHDELVVPLAIGRHVDHQLVRSAAERVSNSPVIYYEDFPYCEQRRALHRVLKPQKNWTPRVVSLPIEALAAKRRAAEAYTSQVDMIFGSTRRLRRAMQRHHRRLGGERYWRRVPRSEQSS